MHGATPAPARPAGLYAWYVALLLALGHLVSFIDRFVMSLVMEPLKADLGLSDVQLGLLQWTGFVLLYTVVAVPLGLLADRVNRRNLIVGGIVLWSVATACCGLAGSFGTLFLARVGVGFGEAALVPAAMSLLAAYFPRDRLGRAVSLFTTGASLGKGAALIGGGMVLSALTAAGGLRLAGIAFAPWQGTFIVMALPGLALALLLFTVREPARRGLAAAGGPGLAGARRHMAAHGRAYALHIGAAALVVLEVQGLAAWAVSFFVRQFTMTPPQAGALVGTVILIVAPLGHLAGGALTDLFQHRGARSPAAPVMVLGLAGVIPAALLFAGTQHLATTIAGYALLNFAATLAAPASLAGVQILTPERLRGGITSIFLAITTLVGIGIGPPLIGLVSDRIGLSAALLLILPAVAVAGIVLALASRTPFARAVAATAAH